MEPIRQSFRYDVFLSFRGEDTRKNFTSHLYGALRRHGFEIFHDTLLPRGLGVGPQLLRAIEESRISVVVFSTNYADSKWCLDELSKMMHCVHLNAQQIVLPIFLDVERSDVRTQQGSYKEAFTHHKTEFHQGTVQKWREALQEAGELPGLHLQHDANGDEEKFLNQIVEKIRKLLHGRDLHVDPVVGIESRIQEMISLLNRGCDDNDDVCVIAVRGPAGIGKTTVAKATYNRLSIHFKAQHSCFLEDVKTIFTKANGKVILQKQLISNLVQNDDNQIHIDSYHQGIRRIEKMINQQKVLLVLDDVDNDEQLKILGMNRTLLGRGSRIIVTTRDESVVRGVKPDATYEPRLLDESESMEVLCLNAFGQDHPKEEYEEVLKEAVCWGERRPAVLKELGSRFRRFQSVQHWRWAMKDLIQNSSW